MKLFLLFSLLLATSANAAYFNDFSGAQNCVKAGPSSGGAGAVKCRSLVTGDLPSPSVAKTTIATQAISGTSIDWSTGNAFTKTLSANTTFTFSNQLSGQIIVVRLTNTASNYTVTWPAVSWPGGTTPTMTTGAHSDVYTFFYDGTTIYGNSVQNY